MPLAWVICRQNRGTGNGRPAQVDTGGFNRLFGIIGAVEFTAGENHVTADRRPLKRHLTGNLAAGAELNVVANTEPRTKQGLIATGEPAFDTGQGADNRAAGKIDRAIGDKSAIQQTISINAGLGDDQRPIRGLEFTTPTGQVTGDAGTGQPHIFLSKKPLIQFQTAAQLTAVALQSSDRRTGENQSLQFAIGEDQLTRQFAMRQADIARGYCTKQVEIAFNIDPLQQHPVFMDRRLIVPTETDKAEKFSTNQIVRCEHRRLLRPQVAHRTAPHTVQQLLFRRVQSAVFIVNPEVSEPTANSSRDSGRSGGRSGGTGSFFFWQDRPTFFPAARTPSLAWRRQ